MGLSRLYVGQVVYFPTHKSVIRAGRNRDIIKKYKGVNALKLAYEYGVSINNIRKLVK